MGLNQFDKGWILGFIEGEGSFTRQIVGGRPHKGENPVYLPSFSINQTNKIPLEFLKKFFRGGSIYTRNYEGKKYWSSKKSVRYDYFIRDKKTLEKLRGFCEGRLKHPDKIMDFKKWKELFNNYVGIEGQKEIAREQMNERWTTPDWLLKMEKAREKRWTPEERVKQSEKLKKRWKDLKRRGIKKLVGESS